MKPDELLEAVRLHLRDQAGTVDGQFAELTKRFGEATETQIDGLDQVRQDVAALSAALGEVRAQAEQEDDRLDPLLRDVSRLEEHLTTLSARLAEVAGQVGDSDVPQVVRTIQGVEEAAAVAQGAIERLEHTLDDARTDLRGQIEDVRAGAAQQVNELSDTFDHVAETAAFVSAHLDQHKQAVDACLVEHADVWDAALTSLETSCRGQVQAVEARLAASEVTIGQQVEAIERKMGDFASGLTDALTADLQDLKTSSQQTVQELDDAVETRLSGWETDLQIARDALGAQVTDVAKAWQAALDSTQEEMRGTDQALAERVEGLGSRAVEDFAGLQVRLDDLEESVAARLTEVHLHLEEAALGHSEETRQKLTTELAAALAEEGATLERLLYDGLERLRGDLVQRYTQAEPWARGGEDYKALAIVRHRGGLWQSTRRTSAEPAPDVGDWMLLVDGIEEVSYEIDSEGAWACTRLSSGRVTRGPVPYPTFRSRGTYKAGEHYRQWETVVRNRTTFMAAQDTDTEPSNGSGHWIQLSDVVQGPKGPAGRDGRSVTRDDLIPLLPQITRMLADEMERRHVQATDEAARAAAQQVRL